MAGKLFYIEGDATNGIKTADAKVWSSKQYAECELSYIKFFDADGVMVVPTAGELHLQFSPEGTIWRDGRNTRVDATTVYDAAVTMPYAAGMVHVARVTIADITFDGVAGGETFIACYWRS